MGLPFWGALGASTNFPTGPRGRPLCGIAGKKLHIFGVLASERTAKKRPATPFFRLGPSTLTGRYQYLGRIAPRPESSRCSVPILLGCGGTRKGDFRHEQETLHV